MQVAAAHTHTPRTRKLTGACLSTVLLLSAFLFAQDGAAAQTAATSAAQTTRRKVITNRELEAVRRKRLAGEADYERRRAAEGLPSQEELRKQSEERDRRFIELAARLEAARVAEEYESLRRELSLVRWQLNQLGTQTAAASSFDNSPPVYYAFPLLLPHGQRSPFFGHGVGNRPAHGRFQFPAVSSPFRHGSRFGLRGQIPGGLSLQLRFGSTPRAVARPGGRFGHGHGGHGRGSSTRP